MDDFDHNPLAAECAELIALNQRLLDSIAKGDWATYRSFCDPEITSFEPESLGHLVEGMEFHRYYFNLKVPKNAPHTTMSAPHVRIFGDTAVLAYTRLTQRLNPEGKPETDGFNETRIWQKQNGDWKHVHFHRSPIR